MEYGYGMTFYLQCRTKNALLFLISKRELFLSDEEVCLLMQQSASFQLIYTFISEIASHSLP